MRASSFFYLRVLIALSGVFCGCAEFKDEFHHLTQVTHNALISHMAPVRPEAQKEAYDRAMKYYSDEKYVEAKKSWQEAVDDGPSTDLGKKAQGHIDKVDKMLKTLSEIQSQ